MMSSLKEASILANAGYIRDSHRTLYRQAKTTCLCMRHNSPYTHGIFYLTPLAPPFDPLPLSQPGDKIGQRYQIVG